MPLFDGTATVSTQEPLASPAGSSASSKEDSRSYDKDTDDSDVDDTTTDDRNAVHPGGTNIVGRTVQKVANASAFPSVTSFDHRLMLVSSFLADLPRLFHFRHCGDINTEGTLRPCGVPKRQQRGNGFGRDRSAPCA